MLLGSALAKSAHRMLMKLTLTGQESISPTFALEDPKSAKKGNDDLNVFLCFWDLNVDEIYSSMRRHCCDSLFAKYLNHN